MVVLTILSAPPIRSAATVPKGRRPFCEATPRPTFYILHSPMNTDTGTIPLDNLIKRSHVLQQVRAFFYQRDFIEVETPTRIPAPANEAFLEPEPAGDDHWLRTSPELHMKRLLAHGAERIFQIGPCYRHGERGSRHNPEFTMIEWYRANQSIAALYDDVQALVRYVLDDPSITFTHRSVQSLYLQYAGWDPLESWDEDRFDYDMATKIEPNLPLDGYTYITDYPAQAAALAQLNPVDPRVAERFEAYIGQIEIANGYGELTNPALQRQRFIEAIAMRQSYNLPTYPLDEPFLHDLATMPPSTGIALGIDRLVMTACHASSIDQVRPFCQGDADA